ncbi:hypothetical protein J1605_001439 [Eschrichtius robustus]|uniref:ceramidase n=1 Tax=Eschrichtius robustus TaxID=9764 RepID=A0AB34I414_ESCRO|nr:hypothetical protein J1605_001439 [Eschrichtius robustus]
MGTRGTKRNERSAWAAAAAHAMAPAGDREGYWGPTTSTLDWCEENYAVTWYIAEFCECGCRPEAGAREGGRRSEGETPREEGRGRTWPPGEARGLAGGGGVGRAGQGTGTGMLRRKAAARGIQCGG